MRFEEQACDSLLTVDHDLELERSARVAPVRVACEGGTCQFSSLFLTNLLLNTHYQELGRLERRESHDHDHQARVDVALLHDVAEAAAHEVRVGPLLSLEGACPEQAVNEVLDVEASGTTRAGGCWARRQPTGCSCRCSPRS